MSTQPPTPDTSAAPAPKPAPAFDSKKAAALKTLFAHCETKRTIAFTQPADQGNVHLFSATGAFIATVKQSEFNEAHTTATAEATTAAAKQKKTHDELHRSRVDAALKGKDHEETAAVS